MRLIDKNKSSRPSVRSVKGTVVNRTHYLQGSLEIRHTVPLELSWLINSSSTFSLLNIPDLLISIPIRTFCTSSVPRNMTVARRIEGRL